MAREKLNGSLQEIFSLLQQGLRCQGSAGEGFRGTEQLMMCHVCGSQMGLLSSSAMARDACVACTKGVFAHQVREAVVAPLVRESCPVPSAAAFE